jgi:hypothetical protein
MPQQYQRFCLTVPDVDLVDPSGNVINAGRTPGSVVLHWMDPQLATVWFKYAAWLARGSLAAASRSAPLPDPDVRYYGGIDGVFAALMYGYNALNVPWFVDPVARLLWRKYVSGPPQSIAGGAWFAEFGDRNYNDAWFIPKSSWPGYGQGQVAQNLKALCAQTPELGPTAVSWGQEGYIAQTPTSFPWIQVPPDLIGQSGALSDDPNYGIVVENFYQPSGFPDTRQGAPTTHWYDSPQGKHRSVAAPAFPIPSGTQSYQLFSFDDPTIGYKRIGAPNVYYLQWAADWAQSVASRSPSDVALAARAYAAYLNAQQVNAYGGGQSGAEAYLGKILSNPAEAFKEETHGDVQTGLQAAAAGAAAIGAAFAGLTFGISALVGGAAALGLTIAAQAYRGSPDQIPRDEFGRFKPVLERGWLAGNPGVDGDAGRPVLAVPDPPQWSRTDPLPDTGCTPAALQASLTGAAVGGGSGGAGDWLAPAALVGGGVLGYLAYQQDWIGRARAWLRRTPTR